MKPLRDEVCPHCSSKLVPWSEQKRKCPVCGNKIYRRTLPVENRDRVLCSYEEACRIDADWVVYAAKEAFLEACTRLGYSPSDFEKARHYHKAPESERAWRDVLWALYNRAVHEIEDPHGKKNIYFEMAHFLARDGRDPRGCLEASATCELMEMISRGHSRVRILAAGPGNACESCQRQNGMEFTIDEAVERQPLPQSNCEKFSFVEGYPFCRCSYLPVLQRGGL